MASNRDKNNNKAISFLKSFRKNEGYMNLVAIDPHSLNVTGVTDQIDSARLVEFINKNNGRRNLYFTVNEPYSDAPDGKLKKEHIHKIHAVYLDADPDKNKSFEEERDRLRVFADDLANDDNPPTYINDSGGGMQAFWLYDKPLDAFENDEAILHHEALSRGLADQYDTDRVQNIDRLMRIPFTMNLPTAKKKNRKPALSTVVHAKTPTGIRYKDFDFITPTHAAASDNDKQYEDAPIDMDTIKKPIPDDLMTKFKAKLDTNKKLHDIYFGLIEKPSRSEYDMTIAKELKWAGFSMQETAHIMWHYTHGKNTDLTKREIARCYIRTENPFADLDAVKLSDEEVERINNQTNPILKARSQGQPLEEDLNKQSRFRSKPLHEMDWRYSGNPIYKDFIYDKSITVMYGQSNVGKSFVAADLAGHIALQRNWGQFKYKPSRKLHVLYICAEAGQSFGKRGKALRKRLNANIIPFNVIDQAPNFVSSKDDAKAIVEEIARLRKEENITIGLVVVDTLATTFEGGNENSSEDMGAYISSMKYIQRYGSTGVLIVHHSGKDQAAGARGHSSLRAATDTEIEVLSEKRGERYHRTIKTRKQREGESDKIIKFGLNVIELGKDEDGDPIDTCHVVLEDDEEFEDVSPSIEDELDKGEKAVYLAHKFIFESKANISNFKLTKKQILTLIHNDIKNDVGVFALNDATNSMSQIEFMTKPNKTQTRAFERDSDKLATKEISLEFELNQEVSE